MEQVQGGREGWGKSVFKYGEKGEVKVSCEPSHADNVIWGIVDASTQAEDSSSSSGDEDRDDSENPQLRPVSDNDATQSDESEVEVAPPPPKRVAKHKQQRNQKKTGTSKKNQKRDRQSVAIPLTKKKKAKSTPRGSKKNQTKKRQEVVVTSGSDDEDSEANLTRKQIREKRKQEASTHDEIMTKTMNAMMDQTLQQSEDDNVEDYGFDQSLTDQGTLFYEICTNHRYGGIDGLSMTFKIKLKNMHQLRKGYGQRDMYHEMCRIIKEERLANPYVDLSGLGLATFDYTRAELEGMSLKELSKVDGWEVFGGQHCWKYDSLISIISLAYFSDIKKT